MRCSLWMHWILINTQCTVLKLHAFCLPFQKTWRRTASWSTREAPPCSPLLSSTPCAKGRYRRHRRNVTVALTPPRPDRQHQVRHPTVNICDRTAAPAWGGHLHWRVCSCWCIARDNHGVGRETFLFLTLYFYSRKDIIFSREIKTKNRFYVTLWFWQSVPFRNQSMLKDEYGNGDLYIFSTKI